MKTIKSFLLVFVCFISVLKAQQPLWHISLLAEETLNEVGPDKIQTAWFVTGRDTVYTIHLQDSKIVGRTTPYDFDTIWTDGDSLYQRHVDYLRDSEQLAAYNGRKNVVIREYNSGELIKKTTTRYGEDWKPDYEQTWTTEGISTLERQGINKSFFTLVNFKDHYKTFVQKHWDTTITTLLSNGRDTFQITKEWENHKEEFLPKKNGSNRIVTIGDTITGIKLSMEGSDSVFSIKSKSIILREHYLKKRLENYSHQSTFRGQWNDGKYHQYQYEGFSDTARYVWRYYQYGGNEEKGILPDISKQLEYDKDSILYKETDFIRDDDGKLTMYKIRIRGKQKAVIELPFNFLGIEPPYRERDIHVHGRETSKTEIRVVEDWPFEIGFNDKNVSQLLIENVHLSNSKYVDLKFDECRPETIIIEIDENKTITSVSRSPSSELWVDGFLGKTKDKTVTTPKKLKTVLYYIDSNGKKRKKKLDYIPLPVELQARNEME